MTVHTRIEAEAAAEPRTGDWVAYKLADGIATVVHRGSHDECYELALRSANPPLYVKYRPINPLPLTEVVEIATGVAA
jgi:hypothetical protein